MALPSTLGRFKSFGIRLHVDIVDLEAYHEIERAPDVAGSPGTFITLVTLPPGVRDHTDKRALGSRWHYKARAVAAGKDPSAFTAIIKREASDAISAVELDAFYGDEGRRRTDTLYETDGIVADASVDASAASMKVVSGEAISVNDVGVLKADGTNTEVRVFKADADTLDLSASPEFVVVLQAATGAGETILVAVMLVVTVNKGAESWVVADVGKPVYISQTAGQATKTKPTAGGTAVVRMGSIFDTSGRVRLNPVPLGDNVQEFLRPNSDVETVSWSPTPLFAEIDEAVADQGTTEISSGSIGGDGLTDDFEVGLSAAASATIISATMREQSKKGDATADVDVVCELRQGAAVISTLSTTGITTTYATHSKNLSQAELDAITDPGDLRYFFEATQIGTGTTQSCEQTWMELEIVRFVPVTS